MPRAPRYNQRRAAEARTAILAGKSAKKALATAMGVSVSTLEAWLVEHASFAEAVAEARAELERVKEEQKARAKAGRKTLYHEDMDAQAKIHAATGKTDADIAKELGVCATTLRNWRESNPSLHQAIQQGRDHWSVTAVEASLLKRAIGYESKEVTVQKIKGKPVVTTVSKRHIPADTRAAQFVLTNRAPDRWSNQQKIQHEGSVTMLVPDSVNDLLDKIFSEGAA